MKTDIQIAQEAEMLPITEVVKSFDIEADDLELYGKYKAKISLETISKLEEKEDSIDLKIYDKFALRIHKVLDDTNEQRGDGVTLRFEFDNFDEVLSELQRQSIQIVEGPYFNSETALSEAMILDPDGYEVVLTGRSFYPAQPKE